MTALKNYNVPTKSNTKFDPWWAKLNAALAAMNLPDATFGPARDYYYSGFDPRTAAADIQAKT